MASVSSRWLPAVVGRGVPPAERLGTPLLHRAIRAGRGPQPGDEFRCYAHELRQLVAEVEEPGVAQHVDGALGPERHDDLLGDAPGRGDMTRIRWAR